MDRAMSQMRRITITAAVVAAIAASYGIGRYQPHAESGGKTGRRALYYVDPMHPAYRSDKPGIAPDCGMQLEPKYADEQTSMAKMPAGTVSISPDKQQLIGVRTGKVERRSLER